MKNFIAARWDPANDDGSVEKVAALQSRFTRHRPAWAVVIDHPGWLVLQEAAGQGPSAKLLAGGRGVLLGSVHARYDGEPAHTFKPPLDFARLCADLVQRCWGAYVALWSDPEDTRFLALFRDPIGMLDCVTWTHAGIRFAASDPGIWLNVVPPEDLAIDWQCLAQLLRLPASGCEAAPLSGVETVRAGELTQYEDAKRSTRRLWHPRRFCPPHIRSDPSPEILADIVDGCIAAWLGDYEGVVAEISGGLDSAIVVASAERRRGSVLAGFHFYTRAIAGDERRFAHPIAEFLGIPLHDVEIPVRSLEPIDLADMPVGIRPGLGSTSLFHDRALAHRATAMGARALLTGQGGDAAFFQHPAPEIAAELSSFSPSSINRLATLSFWTGESYWNLLGQAVKSRFGRSVLETVEERAYFLSNHGTSASPVTGWMEGTSNLAPAKRMQIRALDYARSAFGPSWCSQVMTTIHPLMSQPIVEHVLGISIMELTEGRRDRALARSAFAGRLPDVALHRRGKGSLTSHFGRTLAASVPFLRAYLLDGSLVSHGILDRAGLEHVLDHDHLMQFDCYSALMTSLLVEQWVRTGEIRITDGRHGAAEMT